ncbi:MAG TPA: DUF6188 family protein, partial [Nitrospiraceae bacterium]
MHGLPADFDGNMLIGRTLEQVCFNLNQIALHFDNDVSIVVESGYSFQDSQSPASSQVLEVPITQSELMRLLSRSIAQVSGATDGTLTLRFDNGNTLTIYDTSKEYESYQIRY